MTSSVPVPRPSEGDETPLTYEQEIHSLLYKARTWGRDLKAIFERERATPGALSPEERRINRVCIENLADDLARIDAAIPLAEARRSSSSPSVPEATQDDIRGRAYVAGWLDGETHGATHGVGTGYEQARAKAEGQAARYVAAYKPAKLDKPISPAVPSSEEAANSDTPPITEYWFAHYVNENMCSLCAQSGIIDTTAKRTPAGLEVGRRNFCICPNGQSLRARVQGENSQ